MKVFRGYGGFGALGHSVYHRELLPRLVEGPWNEETCHIATSGAHTAAITKSGFMFKNWLSNTVWLISKLNMEVIVFLFLVRI